ncbi:hypothetical protein [Chryseobacterium sp. GP-SGM7]|uniref:hypothetical protein n=1 Tax=Chryseobacterium sp. GP-SGM7 TaxID=3411323 RepID=UPI003B93DE95
MLCCRNYQCALVPLLFLYYATPVYHQMNMRVLDIGLPFKAKIEEKVSDFAKIPTDGWNYKTINVKPSFDTKTEENFIKAINQLKENNIDKTGIRFQLSDKNVYADLVSILNILEKTNCQQWGLDTEKTNSLYLPYMKKQSDSFQGIDGIGYCETKYLDMNDHSYKTSNFWNKLIHYSPKESYYLIFAFLILIYCAMLKPKLSFNI